jgi:hypothetical protein
MATTLKTRELDNRTISRWQLQPRVHGLEWENPSAGMEQTPPIWADLALASVVAVLLWIVGAAIFA